MRFGCLALVALAACGGSDSGTPSQPNTVTPAAVATVAVSGATTVEAGKTIQLSAQPRDAAGAAIAGKTVAWSSSSETVATVASDGTVTGKAAGTAAISAAVDGKSGSLTVTVTPALPAVGSVTVSGTNALEAGTSTRLTAIVKDASGVALTNVPVTWSSSDSTLMTVAADGTVNALRIATVTITATANGKSGSLDVTSSLTPYTFSFPAGTSASDAQLIKDAVQYGSAFFRTAFGRTIVKPTTVTGATSAPGCDSRAGNAAFTGAGAVTFCVANQGWIANGPISRQKITVHELFHVWQFESKWLGGPTPAGADWIIEGSAELVGYLGIDSRGLLPIQTVRGCVVKEVTDFAKQQPPGLPPLSTVESAQAFQQTVGPLYSYALSAMDQLTTTATNGVKSLVTYGDAIGGGAQWQTAFQSAFGQTTAAFYAQFPAYYASLPIPPTYSCRV